MPSCRCVYKYRKKYQKLFLIFFIIILFFLSFSSAILLLKKSGYGLTLQISASMPRGIYFLEPIKKNNIKKNDLILFRLNKNLQQFLITRSYINIKNKNILLLKPVLGLPNDWVCINNQQLFINHQFVTNIYQYDTKDRPLPQLKFCKILNKNSYFLISLFNSRSFDSRYFGVINFHQFIAKAKLLFLF